MEPEKPKKGAATPRRRKYKPVGPTKRKKVEKLRYMLADLKFHFAVLFSLFFFLFLASLTLFSYLHKNYRHFPVLMF